MKADKLSISCYIYIHIFSITNTSMKLLDFY